MSEPSDNTGPRNSETPASSVGASASTGTPADRPIGADRDLYRLLVEHSLGLICTHDLDGTLLLVNRAAARALGYSPEAGVGRNLREFMPPDARQLFDAYLQRMRDHGQDEGLMRVSSRSGDERIWMYRNILFREPGGEPCVLGHALDVTERIAAERALRESEQALLRAHAEMERRVLGRTEELQQSNQRLRAEMYERRRAEETRERALLHERDTLAFLGEVSLQLTPVVDLHDVLAALQRLPVPFLADWTLVSVVDDDGTVRSSSGAHVDPERHAAVAALAAAANGRPDPGSVLSRAIAGGRPELVAGTATDVADRLLGPGPAPLVRELGPVAVLLLPARSDGKVVLVLSLASSTDARFTDSDVAIAGDLLARVETTLQRVKLYHAAKEANRLKDDFLSTLSHELRTPLNAIVGWSRILRLRNTEPALDKAIDVIERNAQVQAKLIEEILDASRIVTGKLRLAIASVRPQAVVRAALDAIRPAAYAKDIRVHEQIDDDVPAIMGDATRLEQVMSNLLGNALKFTAPNGAITVTLTTNDGMVELAVADTGAGIRRDVLPFVFDRFRQEDSSSSRAHGGLGLGLAIVRDIVHLHGGRVRAQSGGPGQGATFVVRLPLAPDVPALSDEPSPTLAPPSSEPVLRGRRVLVVEDDPDARHLVWAVLEGAGADVVTASSAADALDELQRAIPDVVVADIGLPGEDGYALIRRIRQLPPETGGAVPAIALTAYARAADREHALAAGFDRHIVKPVDPLALARAVASAVRKTDG